MCFSRRLIMSSQNQKKSVGLCRPSNVKLAFISGDDSSNLEVQVYIPELDTWSYEKLAHPSRRRVKYTATIINKNLIIAGGIINGTVTRSVERYDLCAMEWTDLPPMGHARTHAAMAELNGNLYIVGGHDGDDWSPLVEKYDFATRKWQDVAPLLAPYKRIKLVVLDGRLYAFGYHNKTKSSMDCYDPNTNEWSRKAYKNERTGSIGVAAVGSYLYAVGGRCGKSICKFVERYHPLTDMWTFSEFLTVGRKAVKCAALNNRLVVCGGVTDCSGENHWTDVVEEYNPETKKWRTLAPLLPHQIAFHTRFLGPL